MTLDPARPEKTRRGVWGGVAPPVGLGFGIPPAARVRVRPHYPELPGGFGFGIGFWVWVIFPGFWRMLQTQISNISRHPNIQKNQSSNISRRAIINSNTCSI